MEGQMTGGAKTQDITKPLDHPGLRATGEIKHYLIKPNYRQTTTVNK